MWSMHCTHPKLGRAGKGDAHDFTHLEHEELIVHTEFDLTRNNAGAPWV